ncbi:pilin [Dyella ginsengisoli]|uniref:pilin n=1 Tax=Dyella ginsengisoli TaxID=363848 RepID=UPI00034C6B36|nr:pilin [Dyella ginsengisoli]
MGSEARYWIGRNGQKFGPYSEANVRQWIGEGRFDLETLAWREGMATWQPLAQVFPDLTPAAPPPFSAPAAPPGDFFSGDPSDASGQRRADLPAPPSMHWGVLLLLVMVTFGLFGLVWPFIQSSWVRKVDPRSRATLMLGLAFGSFVLGYVMVIAGAVPRGESAGGTAMLGSLLMLAYFVLFIAAYFSMAGSLERHFSRGNPAVRIGGITLFFFNVYYLQGQLRWLARWKETGRTTPPPPKGVFYLLWAFPFGLAILAAIAIPSYQGYLVRAQVSEAFSVARSAESAVAGYYAQHGDLPKDNADAGIGAADSLTGRYVSAVDVDAGKLVIHFDSPQATATLRGRVLVLEPHRDGQGQLQWSCNSPETTIRPQYLPVRCRP